MSDIGSGTPYAGSRTTSSVWQDMNWLTELRDELMTDPTSSQRDVGRFTTSNLARGYKPRDPDPRWILWLTVVLCVLTFLSVPVIIHMGLGQ